MRGEGRCLVRERGYQQSHVMICKGVRAENHEALSQMGFGASREDAKRRGEDVSSPRLCIQSKVALRGLQRRYSLEFTLEAG